MASAEPQAAQFQHAARRLLVPCLLGFVLANVLVWFWVKGAGLEAQPVDLQTRLVYRLRLDSFFAGEPAPRAVFVGDSLVHGAHLREREGSRWVEHTLPAQFGAHALNLGVDGLLFSELACVVHDVLARKPELLVVVISPRPLAAELAESARPFLCPVTGRPALDRFGDGLSELAYRGVPAYRYRDLLQLHYLDTTPRAFLLGQLTPRLQQPDGDDEPADPEEQAALSSALQRMRAAQRLASIEVNAQHPQAHALTQLLAALKQQTQTRVLVVYLRENLAVLAGALDTQRYEDTAQRFSTWVSDQLAGATHSRFLVESAEPYAGEYIDHIHLSSRGYKQLAARLHMELGDVAR
jgi:lysophospholipase L1-like esterase